MTEKKSLAIEDARVLELEELEHVQGGGGLQSGLSVSLEGFADGWCGNEPFPGIKLGGYVSPQPRPIPNGQYERLAVQAR